MIKSAIQEKHRFLGPELKQMLNLLPVALLVCLAILAFGVLPAASADGNEERAERLCKEALDGGANKDPTKISNDMMRLSSLKLINQKCPKIPETHYNLGVEHFRRGQFPEALQFFRNATELGEDPAFKVGLANAFMAIGKTEDARRLYEQVLNKDDKSVAAIVGMAAAYQKVGNYDAAEKLLREAIEVEAENTSLYLSLGGLLEIKGDADAAIAIYRIAVEKLNGGLPAMLRLGTSLSERGQYSEAERVLRRAHLIAAGDPAPANALAGLLIREQRYEAAHHLLTEAYKADRTYVPTLVNLSIVEYMMREVESAEKRLLDAADLVKDSSAIYSVLGWLYLNDGKREPAERALEKAIALDEQNGVAHYNLGVLKREMGNEREAKAHFARAKRFRVNPDGSVGIVPWRKSRLLGSSGEQFLGEELR